MIPNSIRSTEQVFNAVELSDDDYVGIAEGAGAKVANLLAQNYAKPDSTLRELVTNAVESKNDAGSDRKVEITFPSVSVTDDYHDGDNNLLSVIDYGLGMSEEHILKIMLRLGASTKENDNDHAGGMGIGALSPLHMAPSFFVTSAKDGKLTKVKVYQNERGIARPVTARADWATKTLVAQMGTIDLPEGFEGWNGENFTRIDVPVEPAKIPSLLAAAEVRVQFYSPDDIHITNTGWDDKFLGKRLGGRRYGNLELVRKGATSGIYGIVAGVAYPLEFESFARIMAPSNPNVIWPNNQRMWSTSPLTVNIHLDNTEVKIPPSRETLDEIPDTSIRIEKILAEGMALYTAEAEALWNKITPDTAVEDRMEIVTELRNNFSTAATEWDINAQMSFRSRDLAASNFVVKHDKALSLRANSGEMVSVSGIKIMVVKGLKEISERYTLRGWKTHLQSHTDATNSAAAEEYLKYAAYDYWVAEDQWNAGEVVTFAGTLVTPDQVAHLFEAVDTISIDELLAAKERIGIATRRQARTRLGTGAPTGDGTRSAPSQDVYIPGVHPVHSWTKITNTDLKAMTDIKWFVLDNKHMSPARFIDSDNMVKIMAENNIGFINLSGRSYDRLSKIVDIAGRQTPDEWLKVHTSDLGLSDNALRICIHHEPQNWWNKRAGKAALAAKFGIVLDDPEAELFAEITKYLGADLKDAVLDDSEHGLKASMTSHLRSISDYSVNITFAGYSMEDAAKIYKAISAVHEIRKQ